MIKIYVSNNLIFTNFVPKLYNFKLFELELFLNNLKLKILKKVFIARLARLYSDGSRRTKKNVHTFYYRVFFSCFN